MSRNLDYLSRVKLWKIILKEENFASVRRVNYSKLKFENVRNSIFGHKKSVFFTISNTSLQGSLTKQQLLN